MTRKKLFVILINKQLDELLVETDYLIEGILI